MTGFSESADHPFQVEAAWQLTIKLKANK